MTRVLLGIAAAAIVAAVVLAGRADDKARTADGKRAGRPVVVTPASQPPSAFTIDEIDQQDRRTAALDRRVAEAYNSRALLAKLPTTVDGVRITIAGLAADNRTTILMLSPRARGPRHAREVYRHALATLDDSGAGYRVRISDPPLRHRRPHP